ncbi:MAG TPA: tyrosine-type recombinase/integrase [Anaerolineaceae bacterium]|nr:tyrosine-type recombinase/integrase [Anaerolineaceae bacterium]
MNEIQIINRGLSNGFSEGFTDLQMAILQFLTDRKSQNLSVGTINLYKKKLLTFENFCRENGVNHAVEITPDLIRLFIMHLQNTGHNSGGVLTYYKSIRAFLLFYWRENEPDTKNPIMKVKSPRCVNEPIEGICLDNFQKLLSVCDSNSFFGQRDKTILLLLLETGVRAQELLNINIEDIDITYSSILIRQGKGRKPRTVFMGSSARRQLKRYLKILNRDKGALFINKEGDRLKYGGLREVIRRVSLRAGLPEQGIHGFRRTFALEQLRRGVDIYTISRLMGHTSLQVLSRYLKQTTSDLQVSYRSIIDS